VISVTRRGFPESCAMPSFRSCRRDRRLGSARLT
jgi:hypothetical protein